MATETYMCPMTITIIPGKATFWDTCKINSSTNSQLITIKVVFINTSVNNLSQYKVHAQAATKPA
jgi:hypothetical protein